MKVNATAKFSEDKKSATLELTSKLTQGEYTVSVTGLADEALTSTFVAEDEKVAEIKILSENAIVDNSSTPTEAKVAYQVTNQYGEDITKTTSLTTNDNANIVLSNGTATIDVTGKKVGDKLPLTLINVDSAVNATQVLTLSAASSVSEVSISGLYNKDSKALNEDADLATDAFYLLVEVKDQYGNVITDPSKAEAGLIKSQSNPTVVATAGAGNAVNLTSLTVDGKSVLGLKLSGPVTAGENQVTLISTTTGKNNSFKLVVDEATRSDAVTLSQPALAVAKEDVYLPVSVSDKNGVAITDAKLLNNATKGVTVSLNGTAIPNAFVTKENVLYAKVPKTSIPTEGIYSLVAQSSTFKVSTLTLNVKKEAVATVIRGLKSTVSATVKASDTKDLDASSLVIEDQYGRVMDSATVKAALTGGKKIVVKKADATATAVTVTDTDITDGADALLTAGSTNGTEKLVFVLNDGVKDIASSAAEVSFRVTDGTEYKSYEVGEIGTVYDEMEAAKTNAAAYDKEIKVYGVLNDGSKVQLNPATDFTVKSTLASLASDASDGVINTTWNDDADNGTTPEVGYSPTYASNATEKEVNLTVTINATGEEFTKTVKFSNEAPKVSTVSFVDDSTVTGNVIDTLAVSGTTFSVANLATGALANNILITDQYGAEVVATSTTGAITFADTTAVAAPTLTVTPVKGAVTIANNGLKDAAVSNIDAGEEFSVKVTYAGGASATIKLKK